MRAISMERVEQTRQEILDIIESPILTHEQKVANMAGKADSLMEVLDLPEGLDESAECTRRCEVYLRSGRRPCAGTAPLYHSGLSEVYERGEQIPAVRSS